MAFRRRGYRSRRTTRARRFKRRRFASRFNKSTRWRMPRSSPMGLIVPDAVFTKMSVVDTFTLNMTSGVDAEGVIRGNDLVDPADTLGAEKPTGYTQYKAFYDRFVVYASKITMVLTSAGSTNQSSQIDFVLVPSPGNLSGGQDPDDIYRLPYAKMRTVVGPNASPPAYIKHYMSTNKIFGLPKNSMAVDAAFWGVASTDTAPSRLWYWNIVSRPVDDSTTSSIRARVKVTYFVKWFSRKNLSTS